MELTKSDIDYYPLRGWFGINPTTPNHHPPNHQNLSLGWNVNKARYTGGPRYKHHSVVTFVKLWCASKTYIKILGPLQKIQSNCRLTLKNPHANPRFAPKMKLPIKVHIPQTKILGPPLTRHIRLWITYTYHGVDLLSIFHKLVRGMIGYGVGHVWVRICLGFIQTNTKLDPLTPQD